MPILTIKGRRIRTEHVKPPIPTRDYDYSAVLADEYDGAPDAGHQPQGWGSTEQGAVDDLLQQIDEGA